MRVALRFIYYKAVTPSMYIVDMPDGIWHSFLSGDNDVRLEIACRLLRKEAISSYIREVAWIPLDGQTLLCERKRPEEALRNQRQRVKTFLKMQRNNGEHLRYLGRFIAGDGSVMDTFLHYCDADEGMFTGLPIFVLVEIYGAEVRFADADETMFLMNARLPKGSDMEEGNNMPREIEK